MTLNLHYLRPKLTCPTMTLRNDPWKDEGNCTRLRLRKLLIDVANCKIEDQLLCKWWWQVRMPTIRWMHNVDGRRKWTVDSVEKQLRNRNYLRKIGLQWECKKQEPKTNDLWQKIFGLRSGDLQMCLWISRWRKAKKEKMKPKLRLWVYVFWSNSSDFGQRSLNFRWNIFGRAWRVWKDGGGVYFRRSTFEADCDRSWKDCRGATYDVFVSCVLEYSWIWPWWSTINKLKLVEFSLIDLLNDIIVPLVKCLDRKMTKYSVSASTTTSYLKLVHRRTKTKAIATAEVTERVASLTSECAIWHLPCRCEEDNFGRRSWSAMNFGES